MATGDSRLLVPLLRLEREMAAMGGLRRGSEIDIYTYIHTWSCVGVLWVNCDSKTYVYSVFILKRAWFVYDSFIYLVKKKKSSS